jgi:TusA-related sulfurtransferase
MMCRMKFRHDLEYDAAPDEVHAMLADRAFREKVCVAIRSVRHTVAVSPDGQSMSVLIDQTQPAKGIPSFAQKFVGDEIRVVQEESWTDGSGADLSVTIPGKPGHLKGAIRLSGNGSGTVETVSGDIKVSIPLLGGKLEALIGDLLGAALDTEERVGRAWLAGDR